MENNRYHIVSRALHWSSALLIIALIGVGLYMTGLADDDPARRQIYSLHKAFGVLTLFLLIARLIWLRVVPAPELPAAFGAKDRTVLKGVQALLYLSMLLLPLSGYVMSTAAGFPISFFGLFELPRLIGENKELAGIAKQTHEILGYAILAFVVLHVLGAIKHRLKDRDGPSDVLARML